MGGAARGAGTSGASGAPEGLVGLAGAGDQSGLPWLVDVRAEPAAAGPRVTAGVGPGGGFVQLALPLGL
ncbi:hypothetical protein BE15_06345 [Sorangium cellulosum]|uniref:Uncharacterized protein n=2 Tax=Polyangiaceae TaxID=49 RepID=A0A150Q2I8_SORCE|nr:hypothetical protein BE15_06345 [Sorangium cellulosum]